MTTASHASAQGVPLLKTKFYIPPLRPELVPRLRLIERLNTWLGRKLTLISAPAGFGKTTLLSSWTHQIPVSVAWFSLDEGDNDLTRFLAYLAGALQAVDVGIGGALGVLQSPQSPPIESVLTALINEIAAVPDPPSTDSEHSFALVLNDYHLIKVRQIHSVSDVSRFSVRR